MTLKKKHDAKNRADMGKIRAKFEQNSSKKKAKEKQKKSSRGKVTLKIVARHALSQDVSAPAAAEVACDCSKTMIFAKFCFSNNN